MKIDDFLTKTEAEDAAEEDEEEERVQPCNIEAELRDPELPFLGKPLNEFFVKNNFKNVYDLRGELEREIKAAAPLTD